jgi:hypothetical protein
MYSFEYKEMPASAINALNAKKMSINLFKIRE